MFANKLSSKELILTKLLKLLVSLQFFLKIHSISKNISKLVKYWANSTIITDLILEVFASCLCTSDCTFIKIYFLKYLGYITLYNKKLCLIICVAERKYQLNCWPPNHTFFSALKSHYFNFQNLYNTNSHLSAQYTFLSYYSRNFFSCWISLSSPIITVKTVLFSVKLNKTIQFIS